VKWELRAGTLLLDVWSLLRNVGNFKALCSLFPSVIPASPIRSRVMLRIRFIKLRESLTPSFRLASWNLLGTYPQISNECTYSNSNVVSFSIKTYLSKNFKSLLKICCYMSFTHIMSEFSVYHIHESKFKSMIIFEILRF